MTLPHGFNLEDFELAIKTHGKSYCPLCYAKGNRKNWLSKDGKPSDCVEMVNGKTHYQFTSFDNCIATLRDLID